MDNIEVSRDFFIIAYDGDALRDHSIDIRTLTPTLLAVSDLVREANNIINGEDVKVKTGIKAFEAGSFEIHFEVVESFIKNILNYFSGSEYSGLSNILGIGAPISGGIFWLIKEIRGRKIKEVLPVSEKEVKITFPDGEIFTIDRNLYRLYKSPKIRQICKKIIADPLKEEGIETVEIRNKKSKETRLKFAKEDAVYFETVEKEETLIESDYEAYFDIISLTFDPKQKWRLNDGSATLYALIKDEVFLKKIENREISFRDGDKLFCHVHTKQLHTKNGLKKEYEIIEVLKHYLATEQLDMFKEKCDL